MKRLRIAVDVDGVAAEGVPALAAWAKTRYGIDIRPETIVTPDFHVSGKRLGDLFAEAYRDADVVLGEAPVDGAQNGIRSLAERHEVHFLTARPQYSRDATVEWVQRHFGDLPVEMARPTDIYQGHAKKTGYGFDVLVDDNVLNAAEFVNAGGIAILLEQPWNRLLRYSTTDDRRLFRATDWREVLDIMSVVEQANNGWHTFRPILALSGKARHGKDTAMGFIREACERRGIEVVQVGFADALKEQARGLGWNGEKDVNGRTLLQYVGVRERRDDPLHWVRKTIDAIVAADRPNYQWVLTDCRFRNEADAVNALGGRVWRILRINPDGTGFDNGLTAEQKAHESETALDGYDAFSAIEGVRSIAESRNAMHRLVEEQLL